MANNKQLSLNLKNGKLDLIDTPIPILSDGYTLIKTNKSLISPGTERMLLEFGKSSWLSKIKNHQDKIHTVLDSIKKNGINETYNKINNKLSNYTPLGYSNIGTVVESSSNNLSKGDIVVSNGTHSEFCLVPNSYCIKLNDPKDDFLFSILGSISLNALRKINNDIGANTCIIGMGVLGIISNLFLTNHNNTLCVEQSPNRISFLQNSLNINCIHPTSTMFAKQLSRNFKNGFDNVVITANSKNSSILDMATDIVMENGKIVQLGVNQIQFNRDKLYRKNILFTVSSSYGPGRHINSYESLNIDLPIQFSRWTAGRNIHEATNLINKNINLLPKLISKSFKFSDSNKAYESLKNNDIFSIKLEFDENKIFSKSSNLNKIGLTPKVKRKNCNLDSIILGAASQTQLLLPKIIKNNFLIKDLISKNRLSSKYLIDKYNFEYKKNYKYDNVFIITPNNTHSNLLSKYIKLNKNIFLEKPMLINKSEYFKIEKELVNHKGVLHINFNRRYSKAIEFLKKELNQNSLININYEINAGDAYDISSLLADESISGGSLVGEGCHFIDLCLFLTNSVVENFLINKTLNNFTISINFKNGSMANISYFTNGNKKVNKEKISIYNDKNIYLLDDFKNLRIINNKKILSKKINFDCDKGHLHSIKSFHDKIFKKINDIKDIQSYLTTTRISLNLGL